MSDAHVRIDLRRGQIHMAEQLLHEAKVGPRVEQVRGITVPDLVRRHIGRQIGKCEITLQKPLDLPHEKALLAPVYDHRRVRRACPGEFVPPLHQHRCRDPAQRAQPLFVPFSQNAGHAALEVDLPIIQPAELAHPQPAAIEQLHHQPVPPCCERIQAPVLDEPLRTGQKIDHLFLG